MTLFRIFNTKDNLCKRKFLRITFALSLFFFFGLLASVISSTSPGFFTSSALAATGEFSSAPTLVEADYPTYFGLSSRVIVWILAQLHLFFAAFVLAVPIFVVILEALGMFTKDKRYDKTAFEFLKVCLTAYSVTAFIGGLLAISLMVLYPDLMDYLFSIFGSTILFYAFIFFAETATLYIYYYGWRRMVGGKKKWLHLGVGLLLNSFGTGLMFVANAWVTFMMSPEGVDLAGTFDGNVWHAINNHLWNPINLHRFIANLAYGGSIVGAYAAYKFLGSSTDEERGHYDWMGYTANFIAICALLPLPFAGYWLTAEIYAFSQQMGITLMGGFFAWIFIVQAVLIGALFLAANYYLWCAMERSKGSERFTPYIKYIGFVLVLAFLVWFTPHTLIQKPWEMGANQGGYHPLLSPLGLMPAKNIAVNIMILATFLSFLLYRRVNILPTVKWAKKGTSVQVALFTAGVLNIVILGIYYGYYTNTIYKVASSVPQVLTTLLVIVICMIIDVLMLRGARPLGELRWGKIAPRSQYALILIAVSFTWLMGLMGFVRSAIRQHWHVYKVMRDNSIDAFTPTIGYASKIVSLTTIIFMLMIIGIFWLGEVRIKKDKNAF